MSSTIAAIFSAQNQDDSNLVGDLQFKYGAFEKDVCNSLSGDNKSVKDGAAVDLKEGQTVEVSSTVIDSILAKEKLLEDCVSLEEGVQASSNLVGILEKPGLEALKFDVVFRPNFFLCLCFVM
jgi:hypothetical protein